MGIKYKCKCGKVVKFPDTPNSDTDKYERLAFLIYSAVAKDRKPCFSCVQNARAKQKRVK